MRFRIDDGKPYLVSGGRVYPVKINGNSVKVNLERGELAGDAGYYCLQEVIAKLGDSSCSFDRKEYTQEELEDMPVSEIKALAAELGYSITATRKADIISEFLAQQEG